MADPFTNLIQYCETRLGIEFACENEPDEILVLSTHLIIKWDEFEHPDGGFVEEAEDLLCYIYFDPLYPVPISFYQQYSNQPYKNMWSVSLETGKKCLQDNIKRSFDSDPKNGF